MESIRKILTDKAQPKKEEDQDLSNGRVKMLDNLGRCRKCGKRIRFIKMLSGKMMPVDETFIRFKVGGKDRLVTATGEIVCCTAAVSIEEADGYGYSTHFATCPKR